ncbi:MAG: PaaI family thioesterase [Acidobacteriaceae bacterium]
MKEQTESNQDKAGITVSPQGSCFVCGCENPHGLRLQFEMGKSGESFAEWSPGEFTEGFRGIVHGGIICTVLDEAMSKAVAAAGHPALTAELRVRLRHHVAPHQTFRVRGWIESCVKRLVKTEAEITDADGTEFAHAWASFLMVK